VERVGTAGQFYHDAVRQLNGSPPSSISSHTGGPDPWNRSWPGKDKHSREKVFCKDQHSKSKHTKCLPSRQKFLCKGMPSRQLSKDKPKKVLPSRQLSKDMPSRQWQVFEQGHAFKTIEQGQT
jgi:hypothetical protein